MSLLSRLVVYNSLPLHCDSFIPAESLNESPIVIEGADVYDIMCPSSSLTGNRSNPLDLLRVALPDKDYRFLNQILQEVPSISSDPSLSDEDRINLLTYRLSSGTPAEDEIVMHQLMKVADVLFPDSPSDSVPSEKIVFSPDENVKPSE